MSHMLQYAMVDSRLVYDTREMSDEEIVEAARRQYPVVILAKRLFRFDRCPECEAWTFVGGRLRHELPCPAVKDAMSIVLVDDPLKLGQEMTPEQLANVNKWYSKTIEKRGRAVE